MKSSAKKGLGLGFIIFTLITLIFWCMSVLYCFSAPNPNLSRLLLWGAIYAYGVIVFILLGFGMILLLRSLPSIKERAKVSILFSGIFLVFAIFIYVIILYRYYDQLPYYSYPVSFPSYTFSPLIGIDFWFICLLIYGIAMFFKREPKSL